MPPCTTGSNGHSMAGKTSKSIASKSLLSCPKMRGKLFVQVREERGPIAALPKTRDPLHRKALRGPGLPICAWAHGNASIGKPPGLAAVFSISGGTALMEQAPVRLPGLRRLPRSSEILQWDENEDEARVIELIHTHRFLQTSSMPSRTVIAQSRQNCP